MSPARLPDVLITLGLLAVAVSFGALAGPWWGLFVFGLAAIAAGCSMAAAELSRP